MLWRVAQDNLRRLIHQCCRVSSTLVEGQCTSISLLQGSQTRQLSRAWASTSHGPVIGACLLERAAVLFPDVPEWETEYREWQREWHGVVDKEYPAWYIESGGSAEEQVYSDDGGIVGGEPAPRRTEADEQNDMRSLRRKMDERLFLIVKKGSKKEGRWQVPLAEHVDGETLRGTAERALRDVIGQSCPYWVVGNAPAGHVHLEFGTVFFLRAQMLEGMARIRKSSGCTDYAWVTKEEMGSFMDERTAELMVKML